MPPKPTCPQRRQAVAAGADRSGAGAPTVERERPQYEGLFLEPDLPPADEDAD